MRAIYKFHIAYFNGRDINILADARVVHVGPQNGEDVMLWVELDLNAVKVARRFRIYETGEAQYPSSITSEEYVGTCQTANGLVWHVYEVKQ